MRLSRDVVAGLLCLGLSLVLLYMTLGMPRSALVPIGPDFYPRLVLGATAVLSVALIVIGLTAPAPAAAAARRNYRLVTLTFAAFGVYVGLLPQLGFRAATLLFVAALQGILDPPRSGRRWLTIAVVALITTLATYYVFEHYLSVLLPRGRLTGF